MLNILWPVFIILSFIYAIITGKVNEVNNGIFDALESTSKCPFVIGSKLPGYIAVFPMPFFPIELFLHV